MAKDIAYKALGMTKMMASNVKDRYNAAYSKGMNRPHVQKVKKMMSDSGFKP
jgi:hypothetical protein